MRNQMLALSLMGAAGLFIGLGCAALDEAVPVHAGRPVAQVGELVREVIEHPVTHALATAVPGGERALYVTGLIAAAIIAADQALRHRTDHLALKRIPIRRVATTATSGNGA